MPLRRLTAESLCLAVFLLVKFLAPADLQPVALHLGYLPFVSTPNHRRHFGGVRRRPPIVMRFGFHFRGTRPAFHRRVGRKFAKRIAPVLARREI